MSQDRFIELITKEFIAELSADEASELKSFLQDESLKERHELLKLYLSNKNADHSLDESVFKKVRQKISESEGFNEDWTISNKKKNSSGLFWKIAIAAMLTIVSVTVWILHENRAPANQLAYTKRATKQTLTLSDGTKFILNSESKLVYPKEFSGKSR